MSPMEADEKVRENRLRRMAERRGYRLLKSRRRDPSAIDHNGYMLVDARTNSRIVGGSPWPYSASLDLVQHHLEDPENDDGNAFLIFFDGASTETTNAILKLGIGFVLGHGLIALKTDLLHTEVWERLKDDNSHLTFVATVGSIAYRTTMNLRAMQILDPNERTRRRAAAQLKKK